MFEQIAFTSFHSVVQPPSFFQRLLARRRPFDATGLVPCDPKEKIGEYQKLLSRAKTLALFKYGTCVFSEELLSEREAIAVMQEGGPMRAGDASADMHVGIVLKPIQGTVVTYAHPLIVSFLSAEEFDTSVCSKELSPGGGLHIPGMIGRVHRDADGRTLELVELAAR